MPPEAGLAAFLSSTNQTTVPRPDGTRAITCSPVEELDGLREAYQFWKWGKKLVLRVGL